VTGSVSIRTIAPVLLALSLGAAPLAAQAPAGGPASGAPRLRLSGDGRSYVVFGGQLRERVEGWRGFDFGVPDSSPHDDGFALTRVRLSADLHFGGNLRLFAEGKSALSTNRRLVGGKRLSDVDDPDLHQGYLELGSRPTQRGGGATAARIGRQELAVGRERLVSALDWSNVRRSFDGISVTRGRGRRTLTAFAVRPVLQREHGFNRWDEHTEFFGAYSIMESAARDRRAEVYWLRLNRTVGAERRQTVGVRLSGGGAGRRGDYDVETAYQFGELGGARIRAWMLSAVLGRRLSASAAAPRLWLGFDYASGDKSPGGIASTFDQLFASGHSFFGPVDLVGRRNIVDASGGVSWALRAPLVLTVDVHRFWRASAHDALYNAAASVVRAGDAGASREVGRELDVLIRYRASRHFTLVGGCSRFLPGAFIEESGPSKTVEFAYFSVQYTI
jgi:hypothetical protein